MKTLLEKENMLVTSISFSDNVFYHSQTNFNFSVTFNLLSANDVNLDQSKILSLGKDLQVLKSQDCLVKGWKSLDFSTLKTAIPQIK